MSDMDLISCCFDPVILHFSEEYCIHGILLARVLEWGAIAFSTADRITLSKFFTPLSYHLKMVIVGIKQE